MHFNEINCCWGCWQVFNKKAPTSLSFSGIKTFPELRDTVGPLIRNQLSVASISHLSWSINSVSVSFPFLFLFLFIFVCWLLLWLEELGIEWEISGRRWPSDLINGAHCHSLDSLGVSENNFICHSICPKPALKLGHIH